MIFFWFFIIQTPSSATYSSTICIPKSTMCCLVFQSCDHVLNFIENQWNPPAWERKYVALAERTRDALTSRRLAERTRAQNGGDGGEHCRPYSEKERNPSTGARVGCCWLLLLVVVVGCTQTCTNPHKQKPTNPQTQKHVHTYVPRH